MKRMHVHVAVNDLQRSIGFYSALFATQPVVVKADYAKWMLDDPRVNFAISSRGKQPGLDHLGIQVEQGQTTCCYAQSEKSWIDDPAGISWETFFTTGESTDYGVSVERDPRLAHANACCDPHTVLATQEACCTT